MADLGQKISELPAASVLNGSELLPIVQSGATKKSTAASVETLVKDNLSKTDVGLGNVANERQYSAQNPPPTPTAADVGAIPASQKGVAGGVAELDNSGKVPIAQLPSFDSAPTEDSLNPVTSGGVYDAIIGLLPTDIASGDPASFPDGYPASVLSLVVDILPAQDGSGDPSPSNLRPISGRNGLVLYHSGEDTTEYDTITVSWAEDAGTIYGGTLDVIMGVLTVDRVLATLDGEMPWSIYASSGSQRGFLLSAASAGIDDPMPGLNSVTAPYICCSLLPNSVGHSTWTQGYCGMQNQSLWFGFRAEDFDGVTAFKTYVNEHPIQIVVPIANPLTYYLTPRELRTLLGENNIWATSGPVTVEYHADIMQYILKKLPAAQGTLSLSRPALTLGAVSEPEGVIEDEPE